MSDDIKELVRGRELRATLAERDDLMRRLRGQHRAIRSGYLKGLFLAAADALEAMAGEVEDLKSFLVGVEGPKLVKQMRGEVAALTAERDRLKAAIVTHVAGCVACGGSGVVFLCPELDNTAEAVREDCEECVGLRKALGGDAS